MSEVVTYAFYDTPLVGTVTGYTILASRVDGVVLVVEAGRTAVAAAARTRDILREVDARRLEGGFEQSPSW